MGSKKARSKFKELWEIECRVKNYSNLGQEVNREHLQWQAAKCTPCYARVRVWVDTWWMHNVKYLLGPIWTNLVKKLKQNLFHLKVFSMHCSWSPWHIKNIDNTYCTGTATQGHTLVPKYNLLVLWNFTRNFMRNTFVWAGKQRKWNQFWNPFF